MKHAGGRPGRHTAFITCLFTYEYIQMIRSAKMLAVRVASAYPLYFVVYLTTLSVAQITGIVLNGSAIVGVEVPMADNKYCTVFWNITACSPLDTSPRFGGAC